MKKSKILFAAVFSFSLLLTGCATPNTETESQTSFQSNVEGNDRTLTIGVGVDLDPFIPISQNEYIRSICDLPYDTLVKYENGDIVPCLAMSWEISDDGKEIIMQLRDDVKFHDGTPFNAETAAKSLSYYKDYEMFSWMKGVASIEKVEVEEEFVIKIIYTEGYYAALNDLSSSYKVPMVSPNMIVEGNYETMNQAVGTGPYVYDSYVKGDYTKFVKNEEYWGEEVAFDEIIVRYIPDSGTRLKALQTGEIDMIFSSDFISYDEYQQATTLTGITGQLSDDPVKTRNIVVNAGSSLLAEQNVRQAIACAIDKETITLSLTYGQEQVADRLFSTNLPYCDVELNHTWEYDAAYAIELLEKSDWLIPKGKTIREKNGEQLKLKFIYPNDIALNKEIVSAIKSNLGEIGIEVETIGMEYMSWYVDGMEGKYDIAIGTTYGSPYDPHNYLNPMMDSMVDTVAISGLSDSDKFFDALAKSGSTADENETAKLYNFMLNYLNNNAVEIPLSSQMEAVIYNTDKIKSYEFGGMPNVLNPFGIKTK
jgi:nickel transport system substrate-binding protein